MVPAVSAMAVSAIIPNLDRADLLATVLESLAAQQLPPQVSLEVIVVDNGSRDESVAVATGFGARTVSLASNQGVSRALNRGIEAARGQWIALVNNDVRLAPDWLGCLLKGASREGAWFATGKTLDATRQGLMDGAGDAVCRGGAAWRLGHGQRDGPAFDEPRPTFFPAATASLFRREFFDRAGLFDESFFAYLEDVDLGMRAAALGVEGIFLPRALAWHVGSETGGRWSDRSVTWITRHQLLLLSKHYSEGMLLRFARPVVAAQLLWAAMAVSRGRGRAWLRGGALGLADWRKHWRAEPSRGRGRLAAALRTGEAEIARFQQECGWDRFWKWYFLLARGGHG